MESVRAESPFIKAPNDDDTYGFIFVNAIGTRTISSVDSITVSRDDGASLTVGTDLEFSGQAPNSATFTDEFDDVLAIGKAVQARGQFGVAGVDYTVKVLVTLSDGRKKEGVFPWQVRD